MEDYKKKYEDSMKKIEHLYESVNPECKQIIEYYFPELKESDDEIIRKELIRAFTVTADKREHEIYGNRITYGQVLSWLEKQGKKVDVIENFNTEFERQISHLIASTINKEHEYNQSYVKWTANALLNYAKHELEKQGEQSIYDVPSRNMILAVWELGNEWKELTNGSISKEYGTQLEYIQKHWNESQYYLRDKQGEQKTTDKVKPKFKVGDTIVEKDLDEYDYETIKDIKDGRYIFTDGYSMNIDEQEGWQLVKTPTNIEQKPAWSEEDENIYARIIRRYTDYELLIIRTKEEPVENKMLGAMTQDEIWLKSLKERYSWKPSDEQMATFWDAICNLNQDGYKWINDMKSLYYDLKKLRKE